MHLNDLRKKETSFSIYVFNSLFRKVPVLYMRWVKHKNKLGMKIECSMELEVSETQSLDCVMYVGSIIMNVLDY